MTHLECPFPITSYQNNPNFFLYWGLKSRPCCSKVCHLWAISPAFKYPKISGSCPLLLSWFRPGSLMTIVRWWPTGRIVKPTAVKASCQFNLNRGLLSSMLTRVLSTKASSWHGSWVLIASTEKIRKQAGEMNTSREWTWQHVCSFIWCTLRSNIVCSWDTHWWVCA